MLPTLPTLFGGNVNGLPNKTHEFAIRIGIENCDIAWVTETKIVDHPKSFFEVDNFSFHPQNRPEDCPRGQEGGGVAAWIKSSWCSQVQDLSKDFGTNTLPEGQLLVLKLRPFRLPREYKCMWLFIFYFPENNAAGKTCMRKLNTAYHAALQHGPDSLCILAGDTNRIDTSG
ncbi:MAG: hypothetical protein ACK559_17490, partial [bacterium]